MCVQVCPVGIDIRNGLQYQCIGCAACIDACNEIMDKMNYPRGLIRYTTESVLEHKYTDKEIKKRLLRPKVVGYGVLLLVAVMALLIGLATRQTLNIDIVKDRGVMVRENKQGLLENTYTLEISNASEKEQILTAKVTGLEDIQLTGIDNKGVVLPAGGIVKVPVQVATQPEYADKGSHQIEFIFTYHETGVHAQETHEIKEQAIFIGE